MVFDLQEEILTMRQFDYPHVLPLHTAFVNNLDVYVISPIMCYNSCRDAMNTYFSTGKSHLSYNKQKNLNTKPKIFFVFL